MAKPSIKGRPKVIPLKRAEETKPVISPKPTLKNAPRRKPLPSRETPVEAVKSTPRSVGKGQGKPGIKGGRKQPSKPPFSTATNPSNANGVNGDQIDPEQLEPGRNGIDPNCPIRALFPFAQDYQLPDAGLNGRRPKITQLSSKMVAYVLLLIRAGGYKQQAAKALGITCVTFNSWLDRGAKDLDQGKSTPYSRFLIAVEKAEGEARISAELTVRAKDPLSWLKSGPGKTRHGQPGWTDEVAVGGGEEPIRVEHEHHHDGKIQIDENVSHAHLLIDARQPSGTDMLANAFSHLEELGIVQPTELGRKMFLEKMKKGAIPVESKPLESED